MNLRVAVVLSGMSWVSLAPAAWAIDPDEGQACILRGPQDPYQPFELDYFQTNYWIPAWKLAGYKTEAEVDRYLGCWKESDANFVAYKSKYKKMIQAAAEASSIPFSILACLYFYESKFDKNVVSPVGAKGLAQIMPGTWKAMVANLDTGKAMVTNPYVVSNLENALKNTPMKASERDAIRALVAKVKRLYAEKYVGGRLSGKGNLTALRVALKALEKYPAFAEAGSVDEYRSNVEAALDKYEMREIFDRYKKALGKSKLTMDPFSPEAAIIMGALTLKVNVFQGIFGQDFLHGSHDRWVIAAGGYNIGPAGIKCSENMSADQCIEITRMQEISRAKKRAAKQKVAYESKPEDYQTSDHMRGIKNCSEHENWKNKLNQSPTKGCQG